ncbi:MAG: Smr/MutS family protein [Beijerinckiaceae bacterium]|nr:Smr/MutS family protein [Beijerinckiaceae bacterium]
MKERAQKSHRPRLRLLSEEEVALWVEVARTVSPQPGAKLPELKRQKQSEADGVKAKALVEKAAVEAKPPAVAKAPALPLAPIERRLKQRISRGRVDIEASVDLHGMRQDEAHAALRHFLLRARQNQAKIVLVVTGKGRSPTGGHDGWVERGILRRVVPIWLSAPDLRHIVLGFEEATLSHGGSGALYVRLRGHRALHQDREVR